jgi:hypothetical protein
MSGSDDSHHAENNINKSMRVRSGSTDSSTDYEGSDEMSHDDDDDDDDDDSGEGEDKESSSYESSDDADDDEKALKLGPLQLNPLTIDHPLSERERQELIRLIETLGVSLESVSISQLTTMMIQFHAVAIKASIPIHSYKYRYLLKRAYISYLRIATTFYGMYFSSAEIFPTGLINSTVVNNNNNNNNYQGNNNNYQGNNNNYQGNNNNNMPTTLNSNNNNDNNNKSHVFNDRNNESHNNKQQQKKSISQNIQNVNVLYSADWEQIKQSTSVPILVCLSVNSLLLLDPDTWEVRMSTQLWDIQDYQIFDGGKRN